MESVCDYFEEVCINNEVGVLYITDFRVFWLSSSSLSNTQFLISEWLKSEKSNKSPRVRLTLKSPPNSVILEFKNGRVALEAFCQLLAKTNSIINNTITEPSLRKKSFSNTNISSISAQPGLVPILQHHQLLDITLTIKSSISETSSQHGSQVSSSSIHPLQNQQSLEEQKIEESSSHSDLKSPQTSTSSEISSNQLLDDSDKHHQKSFPRLSKLIDISDRTEEEKGQENIKRLKTMDSQLSPLNSTSQPTVTKIHQQNDDSIISQQQIKIDENTLKNSNHIELLKQQQYKEIQHTAATPTINANKIAPPLIIPTQENLIESYKKLLNENHHIKSMYTYLVGDPEHPKQDNVVEKVLSPQDFWKIHIQDLAAAIILPTSKKNTEGFLSCPPTFENIQGSATVLHGNSDMMHTILLEDKKIRNIYNMCVKSGKMTVENFWEKFFQTQYFFKFIGKSNNTQKNTQNQISEQIAGIPLQHEISDPREMINHLAPLESSLVEIISSDANRKRGFGTLDSYSSYAGDISDDPHKLNKSNYNTLLSRFNAQSNKLLEQLEGSNSHQKHITVEERNQIALQELELEDLMKKPIIEYPKLCLTRQQLYSSGKKQTQNDINMQNDKIEEKIINIQTKEQNKQSKITIETSGNIGKAEFNENMYETGRHMFIFNTKLCQTEKVTQVASLEYDSQTVISVKAHHNQVMELLKHFYCSKVPEEQKRIKIMIALEQTKNELINAQESLFNKLYAGGSAKALYAPIIEMIDIARNNDQRLKQIIAQLRAKMKALKQKAPSQLNNINTLEINRKI